MKPFCTLFIVWYAIDYVGVVEAVVGCHVEVDCVKASCFFVQMAV